MSNFRDIAPRPLEHPPITHTSSGTPSSSRSSKVAIACGACRARRTKCDGAKPTCRACMERSTTCGYVPTAGPLLAQAQKRKIEELEKDKSSMYEILWVLQTTSPEKASALLQRLRTYQGDDLGEILKQFNQNNQGHTAPPAERNAASLDSPTAIESPLSAILTVPEIMDHPRLSTLHKSRADVTGIALLSPHQQSATVDGLKGPIEMFHNCVGALFYIINREEVQAKLEAMTASGNNHVPLGTFFTNGSNLELKTYAAELAGMAAIGVVHSQLADPATAPPAELADYFYVVAKHGLDSAILHDPLRAMKVCSLLGMYNIVVKATVALAYIELGLSLARNHKLNLKECPPDCDPSVYEDTRRTHRTLVHLQCWLSASLDYMSDSVGTSLMSPYDQDQDAPPEDMIRRECVKVSIIKAALLHRLPPKAPVAEDMILDFRARLSKFHQELPEWMGSGRLLNNDNGELMSQFRPVIYYVHLFYLSAMMLLSRRLIIAFIPIDFVGKIVLPREAQQAIEEGYVAAQLNASVMNLMLEEGKVVQVCWLCIYTAFTAGVMIAQNAAQKGLHGDGYVRDMELLSKCIGVLDYCAQKDALAGKFRGLLTDHLNVLREHNASVTESPESTAAMKPQMGEYLFTFHSGESKLHVAAQELLQTIHRPFTALKHISTQRTLSNRAETTMGTHLEWEYELKERESSNAMEGVACPDPINAMPESINLDGPGSSSESAMHRLFDPPEGEAWSTWTPSTWQDSFSTLQNRGDGDVDGGDATMHLSGAPWAD